MKQLWILCLVYLIIIVFVIIFLAKFRNRGFSRRVLADVSPCPFGKEKYFPVEKIGDDADAKGLVCYSLYGNYAKYAPTLYKQLEVIPQELPDWKARVYVPVDCDEDVVNNITSRGGVVIKMNGGQSFEEASAPNAPRIGIKGHEGALWRFLGATQTKPMICLDADDSLYAGIGSKVKKWLKSKKPFFIFKPWEILLPMAAGRWGARGIKSYDPNTGKKVLRPPLPDMLDVINEYCDHWFGLDECVLKLRIWPRIKKLGVYKTPYWPLTDILIFMIIAMLIASVITLATARGLDKELQICRLK